LLRSFEAKHGEKKKKIIVWIEFFGIEERWDWEKLEGRDMRLQKDVPSAEPHNSSCGAVEEIRSDGGGASGSSESSTGRGGKLQLLRGGSQVNDESWKGVQIISFNENHDSFPMILCDIIVEKQNDKSNEQRKQLGRSFINIVMMLFLLLEQLHDQQEVLQVIELRFIGRKDQASIPHFSNMLYCGYKIKCGSSAMVDLEED
jgi:hypothetical protein